MIKSCLKLIIKPLTGIFLFSLCSTFLFAQNKAVLTSDYREGKEGPALIVSAGDYKIIFSEKNSWTFREIFYKDKKLMVPSGYQQPVLRESNVPEKADRFLGTGHRKEQVESIELIVKNKNGKEIGTYPVKNGLNITQGSSFIVHKKSKFVSEFHGLYYDHESFLTIDEDGIKEEYKFKVSGDDFSNLDFMYVFMHIFPKTTTSWLAGNNSMIIDRGEFVSDNSFSLRKDIRFTLVYDPAQDLGISVIYPEIYLGKPPFKNSFWNRKRDNKHYLQIDPKRIKGEEFTYSATIKAFEAKGKSWENAGKIIVDKALGKSIKF